MDQRTANRLREHTSVGHELRDATDDIERSNIDTMNQRFFRCTCNWFGWLIVRPLES